MGQAEWLMILTCAGYVAPYAWDRLRAEWRSWSTPVQVDTSRLRALLDEWNRQPEHTGTLRKSIRYETVQSASGVISASVASSWCAPTSVGYVLTSGDKDCRTCVNTSTAQDHTDRYECTGSCLPVERPQYWPAGTF